MVAWHIIKFVSVSQGLPPLAEQSGIKITFIAALQSLILARQLSNVNVETFCFTSGYLEKFTGIPKSENSDVFLLSISFLKVSEKYCFWG